MEVGVTKLHYRLDTPSLFFDPAPVAGRFEVGSFELRDEVLTLSFERPCPTIAEARKLSNPLLTAWRLEAEVRRNPSRIFRFAFLGAQALGTLDDETQHSPEELEYEKDDKGSLIMELRFYPPAPTTRFAAEIQAAWERYQHSVYGIGEPIQSAAYYALTVAERAAGNRMQAASLYQMDKVVLRKLGELTSTRGDHTSARKAVAPQEKALTRQEKRWIDVAVRLLILNLATVEAGNTPVHVTLSDLPSLNGEASSQRVTADATLGDVFTAGATASASAAPLNLAVMPPEAP